MRKTQTKASIASERRLAKKKLAQDKKIKSTIKRLRAPKARPLLDLVEGVSPLVPLACGRVFLPWLTVLRSLAGV